MASIQRCGGRIQHRFPSSNSSPAGTPALAAASLKSSVATHSEEREEQQRRLIQSCNRSRDGVSANKRRQQQKHVNLKFNGGCGFLDVGVVAGARGWKRRGRESTAGKMCSRDVGVRGQIGNEQSGERAEVGGLGGTAASYGGSEEIELDFDIYRLEDYTERVQSEVLCVNAIVEDEEDQVIIFKGFSSSLTRATPTDQSEPLLPSTCVIVGIDRMRGPYRPSAPQYIQQGMSWRDFQIFLQEHGL